MQCVFKLGNIVEFLPKFTNYVIMFIKLPTYYFTLINFYFAENSNELTSLFHLMKRGYNNRKKKSFDIKQKLYI